MNIKFKLILVALTAMLMAALSGCQDEAQPVRQKYPYLVMNDVSNVTADGAVFNGEFDLSGTSIVTDYGFEWTYASWSTFEKCYRLSLGNNVKNKFSATITADLWSADSYSVRAYAITPENTVYSSGIIFMSAGAMPPKIISLTPDHGPENTEITIVGKNFGQGNPLNEKYISLGYYNFMSIVSFSDTVIVVKAPPSFMMPKGRYNIEMMFPARYVFNNVSFTFE